MPWVSRNLRGTKVFARAKVDGSLAVDDKGLVDVRYKLEDGSKVYRASAKNLEGTDTTLAPEPKKALPPISDDVTIIYTDGACSGNPGPMGIGVVILRGKERQEIGDYIGEGTNNIAELTAIERAIDALGDADRAREVVIHTDSSYAIGLLAGGFKAKANAELVQRLRDKAKKVPKLRFVKVEGHAGVPENERCDVLATGAIKKKI
jgi:ribonuclease HI